MKNYIDDYYGPKKLSEESLASLIFEMEKAKKGSYKPEDYVTSDIFIPAFNFSRCRSFHIDWNLCLVNNFR